MAAGLQVSPVSLTILERSGIISLSNSSDRPVRVQIRVFRWNQDEAVNRLDATEEVLASPPFVEIEPGGRQVVRLVRATMPEAGMEPCEDGFRLSIDELPSVPAQETGGIQYLMSYSVPVFVTSERCATAEPELHWELDEATSSLIVRNDGLRHARLSALTLLGEKGERIEITKGLLGYVLPGSRMVFALHPEMRIPAGSTQFEVVINGKQVSQTLPLSSTG